MKRTGNNKWFLAQMEHTGTIKMQVLMVIPFILYFSKSLIKNSTKSGGAALYSIHVTPFVSFSFAWRNN